MIGLTGMSFRALEKRYRRWELQCEAEQRAAREARAQREVEQAAAEPAAAPATDPASRLAAARAAEAARVEAEIADGTARRRASRDRERAELAAERFACRLPGAPGGADCPECHDKAMAELHERHVAAEARWAAEVAWRRASLAAR